jgi:hypothetical protein
MFKLSFFGIEQFINNCVTIDQTSRKFNKAETIGALELLIHKLSCERCFKNALNSYKKIILKHLHVLVFNASSF